jgi:hypothetical protein
MTIKNFKVISVAAVGALFSSICASGSIVPGMDDVNIQPAPPNPITDQSNTIMAASPTYSDLDAILGFRVLAGTGSGFEGMIDLGPVSQFTTTSTFTLSLGDIGGFMTSNFGADWYTRSTSGQVGKTDIQWAVVATDSTTNFTNDLWSTRNPAIRSTPWNTSFDQSQPSNDISAAGSYFNTGGALAAGTLSAKKLSSSNANSWTNYQPGGTHGSISFQYFNPTDEGNTSTVLAFDSVPQATTSVGVGTTLGTFTWNADATLLWTGSAVTAVPEPSTYGMMGLGALTLFGLAFLRRRRALRA